MTVEARRFLFLALVLVVTCLTALVVMPWLPSLPSNGLDPSWHYATSYAAGRKMAFGTDFIWTYGPFGAVFTQYYEPRTFFYVLGLSFVLAVGLSFGFAKLADGPSSLALLLLPVLAAQANLLDAIIAAVAFVFVLLASQPQNGRAQRLVLLLLAFLLGAMPNIKGSFLIPAVVGGGSGVLLTLRVSWRLAGSIALSGTAGLVLPWIAIGQRLTDLPTYVFTQFVLMGGFSAMSVGGPAAPVRLFWLSVALLFVVLLLSVTSGRWIVAGSFVLIAFFVFKAGFVRQDGHMLIAGGFLCFIGLALCLMARSWVAVVPLAVGLVGGTGIDGYVIDARPTALLRHAEAKLEQSLAALQLMPQLPDLYVQARQKLADGVPLAPGTGTADIYTIDTMPMLAIAGRWNPRPIVQSYQAYTPTLQRWNAQHLEGARAPDTIFFRPDTIDDRYPAFEDAQSWPALCARYDVEGIDHDFAVLRRRAAPLPISYDRPLGDATVQLGQALPVPAGAVWASIDAHPSWRGRVLDVIYKSSPLRLVVDYVDGHQRKFRLLPEIARSGFLLSPTVETAADFAAFRQGRNSDDPTHAVRSFRVVAEGSAAKDWRTTVSVHFFRFSTALPAERPL